MPLAQPLQELALRWAIRCSNWRCVTAESTAPKLLRWCVMPLANAPQETEVLDFV